MPMATIRKVAGDADLYHIHFLDAGAGHPDQGLPGGGLHPGHRPPGSWPGHPDQGLPGSGGYPGQLPSPIFPDNTLPPVPPPTLLPGYTLVMVRDPQGKWHYAAVQPGGVPPRPLPEPIPPGGAPDQGLPPQPTPAPKPV